MEPNGEKIENFLNNFFTSCEGYNEYREVRSLLSSKELEELYRRVRNNLPLGGDNRPGA
jgi:hypothetical protein